MKLDDFFGLDSIQDEKRELLDLAKGKKYEGISKGDFSDYFKTVASDLQEALGENYLDIIADAINSKAKVDEQINANVEAMKKSQAQLLINNQQIYNMQRELSSLNAAQSQRKQDLEDSISKLQDENSGIETTIKEYQYLCVALGEASRAYQQWLDMQNGPSAGDFSSQTTTAFKQIQQVVKSKNGWGTSDFLYIRLYNTN